MKNTGKWVRRAAVFLCLLFAAAYILVRPAVVARLGPVLAEAAGERLNGSLSWRSVDLDPLYNLEFSDMELKDADGRVVFKSPSLTVGWTLWGAFSAWKNDEGVSAMVQDVLLDAPELYFAEEADGSWNIQQLLKPQKEETPGAFHGRILLKGGAANLSLQAGGSWHFRELEGQFSWLDAGRITAALSGAYEDARFSVNASYTDEKNFNAEISTDPVALTSLQEALAYLPESAPRLVLKDGTAEVTKAEVAQKDGVLTYRAEGRLSGAALSADGYELTDGAADVVVTDGAVKVSNAQIRVNGQEAAADCTVSWKTETTVDGHAEIRNAALDRLLPGEDCTGTLTAEARVSGPLSDWKQLRADGSLSLRDGRIRGLAVESAGASFQMENGKAAVSSLRVKTEDGLLNGTGSYDLGTGDFQVRAAAESLSLAPLAAIADVNGTVTGTISAAGRWDGEALTFSALSGAAEGRNLSYGAYRADAVSADFDGSGGTYRVRFYGSGLSGEGVTADSAAGEAEGNGGRWTVRYLNGTMGGGAFSLRGTYDAGQMNFTAQAGGVEAGPLAALAGQDFGGRVSLSGTLSGTTERPVFDASVSVSDGHYQKASFRQLSGRLISDGEWVTIQNAVMETAFGRHTLNGRVGLSGGHALELEETSEHTRIENILRLADIDAPVTGWIQNETSLRGTIDRPEITGRFLAWDGSAAGELYQSISADYALREDGSVCIQNGLAYLYGGTASLAGTVSMDAMDLEAALVDVDIARIFRDSPAAGRATFRGHLSGSPAHPVFDGHLMSRKISVSGAEIEQVSADMNYADGVVRVTDGFFRQRDGRFRWDGLVNAETGALSGRLHFSGWDLENALQFFQLPVSRIQGEMNGGMVIQGTLDNPSVSLNVNVGSGSLGDTPMGNGRVDLSYANGLLSIRDCYLPVGSGILAAQGTVQNGGAVDLTAAARQMEISWIPQVLGMDDLTLAGSLTAGVRLSGTLDDPSADISVTVTEPKYNGIAFDELSLMGNAEDGVFRLDQLFASKGAYKASARGTMPTAAITRVPDDRNIPFNVDVDLDNADLNALVFMADAVTSASGPVKGHLKITGPWDDPAVQGGAVVRDGTLTVETLSEPVTNIDGTLHFRGKSVELTAGADMGGGSASAAFRANWDHMQLSGYDGEAHVHMPKINSLYYKGNLDGDMTLTEERGLPKVSGTVAVRDAVIDIPMSFASGGGGLDFLMDIDVTVGDNVRLYNSLLYDMNIRGGVHAMGLLSAPAMSGRINVERGTIRYLSNEFNVTEGSAVWGGVPDSFLPVVNVKADTSVGHYKVGMELKGPPGSFVFQLHSEPSLNDTQIMTLLTLRQAPGSADNDAATGALFNAGLSMVFSGGVQDLIRNTFGLDLISITSSLTDYYSSSDSGLNDDYYYVKIGKYLFNDFMLTATMGVNNDEQSYGFRYDLKSRVGLAAWYNNDHDSYIGADYQFQF